MHSIFKLEWIWLFMIISTVASTMSSYNSTTMSSNKSTTMSSYNSTTMSSNESTTMSSYNSTSMTSNKSPNTSSNSAHTSRTCHSRSSYRHQERDRQLHGCCISTPSR